MNKSYLYANGNIHIFNENYEKRVIEYTDNFLTKLIVENNIESIENVILENDKIIKQLDEKVKFYNINNTICLALTGSISSFFIDYFLNININNLSIFFALLGLSFGLFLSIKNEKIINKCSIEKKGYEKVKEELVIIYNSDKKYLEKLNKDNKKNNEINFNNEEVKFNEYKINDSLEQKKLQSLINASLYYGINKKQCLKYYLNGILDEELLHLLPSEVRIINDFVEEDLEKKAFNKNIQKTKRVIKYGKFN